ncbi:Hypothetical predicted protein [Pelobates cultripes]|uniref:Uncharacterized protein n=1 Tax=Pelobates cultripes TaxID=61616 RepID=A0AAD1T596_PELCU|nr:Hypothetical predicted protein [Pelobates cultripes]
MEAMGSDVQQLNLRMTDLEEEREVMQAQITNLTSVIDSHLLQYAATQQHIDDLDNRSRRNNLGIRGMLGSQGENLSLLLTEVFNLILGTPKRHTNQA